MSLAWTSRASARRLASSARATSMSSARSARDARIVTRSGRTSANPYASDRNVFSCPWRYHISPTASEASIGVCPGSTPKYPSVPGISTSSTGARTSSLSGVTICSSIDVGNAISPLLPLRHLVRFGQRLFDRANHVEGLLGDGVVLAVHDLLEALDRLRDGHVLAGETCELLRDEERLGEEPLDLARARDRQLVLFRELVDAEDSDDVLQVLVPLEDLLDRARDVVVLVADDAGVEDARRRRQRVDRGVDAELDDRPRQVRRRVEVGEGRRRRRVGVVVSGEVDRLDRRDRSVLRRGDPLLQLAHFRQQRGLVADGARHAAEERGDLRAGLREAEDVVDEGEDVLLLGVAEGLSGPRAA